MSIAGTRMISDGKTARQAQHEEDQPAAIEVGNALGQAEP